MLQLPAGTSDLSLHQGPDQLWNPHHILFNTYKDLFSRGKTAEACNWMDTHLHLAPRFRISEAIPPFPHAPSWHIQRKLYLYLYYDSRQIFIYRQTGRHLPTKWNFTFWTQQGTPGVQYCTKGLGIATLIKHDGVTVKAIMLPEQN
jgi:hypothetical protein